MEKNNVNTNINEVTVETETPVQGTITVKRGLLEQKFGDEKAAEYKSKAKAGFKKALKIGAGLGLMGLSFMLGKKYGEGSNDSTEYYEDTVVYDIYPGETECSSEESE